MALALEIKHIFETNPLACGQAVLAMLSGKSVEEIFSLVGTQRETTLLQMKNALDELEIPYNSERKAFEHISELPSVALLSLETPKCWHWSLYFKGKFYDPEYGILDEIPPSARRYFWLISA